VIVYARCFKIIVVISGEYVKIYVNVIVIVIVIVRIVYASMCNVKDVVTV